MSVIGLRAEGFVVSVCVCFVCFVWVLVGFHRILRACGLVKIFEGDVGVGYEDGPGRS